MPNSFNSYERERKLFLPFIGVLAGLPLTGKSTLGEAVAAKSNVIFLDVDAVRYKDESTDSARGTEEEEKRAMETAYDQNHRIAQEMLGLDRPVLLAATYSRESYHEQLKKLIETARKPLVFFLLEASDDNVRNRIESRAASNNLSNIRTYEDYASVRDRYQKMVDAPVVTIDTDQPLEHSREAIFKTLQPYRID